MVAASSLLALLALLAMGCPSPVTAPPMEPTIAAPEAPRIPWLAAGGPDIAAPQIPWLTDESACPLGWGLTEVAAGLRACDPYPTGYVEDCGPTAANFPGEAGCRDLDSGDTEWPSDLPATNVIYVREGAMGGDGTRALPFATLPEAVAAATEGTTIAIGPGRYDTGQGPELVPGGWDTLVTIRAAGVHLRGTSVARTTLFSSRPPPPDTIGDAAMIVVQAADVEISDLRFEGPHPAVDVYTTGTVVRRVVLDDGFYGIGAAPGGEGLVEDLIAHRSHFPTGFVLPRGTLTFRRAVSLDGTASSFVAQGGRLVLEDVAIVGQTFNAVVASSGSQVEATRLSVRGSQRALFSSDDGSELVGHGVHVLQPSDAVTTAVSAMDGGRVVVEDLVATRDPSEDGLVSGTGSVSITRAVLVAVACLVTEGMATLSDVICRNVEETALQPGLIARRSAQLDVSRASLQGGGLRISIDSTLAARDVTVTDAVLFGSPVGISASDGSSVTLERVTVERASLGLLADDATVEASDVAFRELTILSEDIGSAGVLAQNGASVHLARGLVDGVEGYGVLAVSGASLQTEDLVVRDFHGPPGRSTGLAVGGDAASGSLARVELSGSESGAVLLGNTTVEDLSIHDITLGTDGGEGFGLSVGAGLESSSAPTVSGARVAIRDVASIGLRVGGAPVGDPAGRVSLALTDVRIERAGTAAAGGAGVYARGDAMIALTRFVVRDAASVGVMSTMGASLVLTDGLVTTTTTCSSSETPIDLTTVRTDACGTGPVTWMPALP